MWNTNHRIIQHRNCKQTIKTKFFNKNLQRLRNSIKTLQQNLQDLIKTFKHSNR